MNHGVRLRVGHQHSRFFADLTHFVDYYSPFWGPKVISMVVEPQGALKCRSSTIAVWADSGPFLVLLLSFGGPGVLADSGPFVDYYSLFWRPEEISTINEPRGAFTCQSSTLTVLAIRSCFMDYYSLFWGPGVISVINEPRGALTCR